MLHLLRNIQSQSLNPSYALKNSEGKMTVKEMDLQFLL